MDRLGVHQFADVWIAVLAGLAEERGSELGGPASTRLERSCWIGLGRTVASQTRSGLSFRRATFGGLESEPSADDRSQANGGAFRERHEPMSR